MVEWTKEREAYTRLLTTYVFRDDQYERSVDITDDCNNYIGECGIGIRQAADSELPKKVTGLEVWLFDKAENCTTSKILFSDPNLTDIEYGESLNYADQVYAQVGNSSILETSSLKASILVVDIQHGIKAAVTHSYFLRTTVQISAWKKEKASQDIVRRRILPIIYQKRITPHATRLRTIQYFGRQVNISPQLKYPN